MRLGGTWFSEPPYAGLQTHLRISRILHEEQSEFQTIAVLDSTTFGRVLTLDRTVQTTEVDEFFYHEMLVHPAMMSHPNPKRALVIGGGDGGALRRVLEHGVEHAVLCELDEAVVRVSKEFLPSVSKGALDDPRSELRFEDGLTYLKENEQRFDVIMVDAPDPVGPAKALFEPEFYKTLFSRTHDQGVVVVQSESPLYMATQTAATHLSLREAFPIVRTYLAEVPSYPGVSWTFTLGMKTELPTTEELAARAAVRNLDTNYYTAERHLGGFNLPAYLEKYLAASIEAGKPAAEHPFFPQAAGLTFAEPFWDKPT